MCVSKQPRNLDCFQLGALRPHIECSHARGKEVHVSCARAHFYVYCSKIGSLWNFTDWWPFLDYKVNPAWVTSWWCLQQLNHVGSLLFFSTDFVFLKSCHQLHDDDVLVLQTSRGSSPTRPSSAICSSVANPIEHFCKMLRRCNLQRGLLL